MQSIKEANEALFKDWETHESTRSVLFSMLDDSEDDSPGIVSAEESKAILEKRVRQALRQRNVLGRITHLVRRSSDSIPIMRRSRLQLDVQAHTEIYDHTSKRRTEEVKTSSIQRYAFTTPDSLTPSSHRPPASLDYPRFTWKLQFKQLMITDANLKDVWTELRFDEASMHKWWRRKHAHLIPSDSDGWSDMKRLARRVVIQILELVGSPALQNSRHIVHLKMMAERAREVVLYQITLCYNLPPQWVTDLQKLFEYTVPIIYLVSEIMRASSAIPSNGIAENLRIEKQLQSLEPYVRELRDRCYLLGEHIGFDVYNYMEEFKEGAIFDFDAVDDSSGSGKSKFIELDRRVAGKNKDEYVKRVGSIGQKQLKVKENIHNAANTQKEPSTAVQDAMVRLDGKVLEEIGLKELNDVVYDSLRWRGSGGYADVYEMNQAGDSKLVAVKICKTGPQSAKRLEREARIWIDLQHKHTVPLLGFVIFDSSQAFQPCLVSKLCHTDLKQLVRTHRNAAETSGKQPLTEERKLRFLRDIVFGLDYLHAKGISHGDLRAANVLVTTDSIDDDSCYAVLNDFGMAEYTDDDISHALDSRDLSSVNQKTNDFWLAPELIEGQPRAGSLARVSKAGDVYAFGVVYLEVIYEKDPYDGTLLNIAYAKSIGELPARKEELEPASEAHWALMKGCWEKVDQRWTILQAASELLVILDGVLPQTANDYETSNMSGLPENFTQYVM